MKMEYKNILPYFSNITQYLTESRKIILLILTTILLAFCIILPVANTSAESFQSSQDVSFTFNPTVNITISGDLRIESLTPGDYKDSNIVTVNASSNSIGGYVLYSTVGSTANTTSSLIHTNGSNAFTSISDTTTSLDDFDDNEWGYSYSTDSGTTWINGDYDNYTTGYNGLPLYTTTGVKLAETSNNTGTSSINFKIGAKAANNQIAGAYTNIINFTAITKILTTNYTITYNDTSSEATNLPSSQSGTITAPTNVTLSSTEPTRTDYNFAGWCTVDNSSDTTTCNGTTYQAGDTYTINNSGGTITIPLYAVWGPLLTDLTGTTWYFNETISTDEYHYIYRSLNFTTDRGTCSEITIDICTLSTCGGGTTSAAILYFVDDYGIFGDEFLVYNDSSGWTSQGDRTIIITGGSGATDQDLIRFLSANATQLQ